MNKIWCIFFMVCSCSSLLFCQEVRDMSLDELRFAATQWNQKDTNRYVDVLNELVFLKRNDLDNVDSVKMWAKRAEELAIANNYLVGEGDALNRLGLLEKKTGNTESAIEYYEKSLIIRRDELRNYSQASSVCNNLGNLFKLQNGGLPKSIFYFQEGLKLLNTAADNKSKFRSKAMIMNNLGWVLALNGQYEDALISFDSSLIIRRELADSVGIANVLLNKGLLFKLNFNYDRSFILWNEALEIFTRKDDYRGVAKCILALGDYYNIKGEYEKAVENYNRALGLSDFLDFDDVATIYQNKGIAHLNLREIGDAEKEFQAGMSFFKKANDEAGINLLFFNYGTFHYENGDYEKAISFFRKILDKTGLSDDLPKRMNLLYFLKDSYIALEDADSALKYANIYTNLKDTIDNSYRDAMNTQYNLAIAENEIQRLNIERAAENQKKMKTFGLIGFGVSWLLLGLAVMGYYLSRQRRRLAEKNIQLAKQEVIELIQEKDLETNYAWMDGVETTRKQIGQELHDSIGSMLSIVKVYFSSLDDKMENIRKDNRDKYDKANNLLDEACDKVRKLSHEMTSAILVKFGLTNQLETLAQTLRDSGQLKVELNTFGLKERLKTQTEFNIYRIIQELVSNVIKHARADKISIQVNRFEDMINIMVEDNGVGFEVDKARQEGGIGLRNVASRVHELEGTLDFDSSPGKGTTVTIDIPVLAEQPVKLEQKPLNT